MSIMTTSCAFFTQSAYKFCQKSQKKSILTLNKDKTDIVRTINPSSLNTGAACISIPTRSDRIGIFRH